MSDKINGRTPEEIKKGLECCQTGPSKSCKPCPYVRLERCLSGLNADALTYIQQLESELAEARKDVDMLGEQAVALDGAYDAMKRERDAAVEDLSENRKCETCKYFTPGYFCIGCRRGDQWQWRGAQEVE